VRCTVLQCGSCVDHWAVEHSAKNGERGREHSRETHRFPLVGSAGRGGNWRQIQQEDRVRYEPSCADAARCQNDGKNAL
jgi:hypothetical protein